MPRTFQFTMSRATNPKFTQRCVLDIRWTLNIDKTHINLCVGGTDKKKIVSLRVRKRGNL